jgi:GntR family transcriptional regulator
MMKRLFQIDETDPTPLYAQLERAIRLAMATGQLKPDMQLPTVRQMAVDLRINANTVAKVYLELERAGIVETRRGVGTFVKTLPPLALRRGDRERQLRTLADRFLGEAALQGFSFEEMLSHLKGRLSKGD